MTVVRTFSPFLQGSRRWLAASVATAVLQAGLLVLVGLLVRRAFDHSIPEEDVRELALVGLALLALALVAGASAVWTRYLVLRAVKDAVARLRIAVLERLNTLPRAWYDRADAETLHATVVQDTERLDVVATAVASQLAPAVVIGTGLGVALLVIDPLLFAIVAVVLPVLAVLTRRFDGVVRRRTRDWQHAFDRFSARVHLAVRGRPLIAAQAAEDVELDAARNEILDLSDAGRQMAWLHAVYAQLHSAVAALSGVVVLVVGGAAVADGRMSLGSLISFSTLLALLRAQGNTALATIPQAISGRESLARLQEILDAPEREPYRGRRKPTIERSLTLRDVHFGYRGEVPVLRGLSLEVERGEHVTLVGANGAGKTTVVSLVLGLYRPWRGTLEADGVPYDELDVRALRRRIGFVPQRPILLPGSVAENIAYGADTPTAQSIREAARIATADDVVAGLADGYDTPVGEDGGRLAGGERQRLAIARALVREPALLILDEPTTSLDRDAVARVVANFRALPHDPAVLLVSHDPAVIEAADRVVVLDGGVASEPALAERRRP